MLEGESSFPMLRWIAILGGWLIMKGGGYGVIADILLGIVGGLVGG